MLSVKEVREILAAEVNKYSLAKKELERKEKGVRICRELLEYLNPTPAPVSQTTPTPPATRPAKSSASPATNRKDSSPGGLFGGMVLSVVKAAGKPMTAGEIAKAVGDTATYTQISGAISWLSRGDHPRLQRTPTGLPYTSAAGHRNPTWVYSLAPNTETDPVVRRPAVVKKPKAHGRGLPFLRTTQGEVVTAQEVVVTSLKYAATTGRGAVTVADTVGIAKVLFPSLKGRRRLYGTIGPVLSHLCNINKVQKVVLGGGCRRATYQLVAE